MDTGLCKSSSAALWASRRHRKRRLSVSSPSIQADERQILTLPRPRYPASRIPHHHNWLGKTMLAKHPPPRCRSSLRFWLQWLALRPSSTAAKRRDSNTIRQRVQPSCWRIPEVSAISVMRSTLARGAPFALLYALLRWRLQGKNGLGC